MTDTPKEPNAWGVWSFKGGCAGRYVVKRETPQGMEFLTTKSGFPREFSTEKRAYAAIAEITGAKHV